MRTRGGCYARTVARCAAEFCRRGAAHEKRAGAGARRGAAHPRVLLCTRAAMRRATRAPRQRANLITRPITQRCAARARERNRASATPDARTYAPRCLHAAPRVLIRHARKRCRAARFADHASLYRNARRRAAALSDTKSATAAWRHAVSATRYARRRHPGLTPIRAARAAASPRRFCRAPDTRAPTREAPRNADGAQMRAARQRGAIDARDARCAARRRRSVLITLADFVFAAAAVIHYLFVFWPAVTLSPPPKAFFHFH